MSRLQELIAELCPDGVEYKTLGQCLLSLRTGLNPRKNFVLNTPDATNYYVTVRELGGVRACPSDKTDLVNDEALALINRRSHLNAGDVLFSGVGTVGRTAYIDTTPENWNIKEGVYALTANPALLASKYLLWFLLSNLARTQFTSGTDGGTVASLSMASLKKLRIPVPPLEVQREIVRILDSFQELDDALTAEIEAREKQFEKYRGELLEERLQKMCPDGVEHKKLVAVADVLYGAAFRSALFNTDGDGLPVIRIRDVLRGYSETFYSGEYEQKYVIGDGDMLLGMDGNFNLRLWSGGKALLNQRVCRISSKDDAVVLNGFLRYWLQPVFKSYEGHISRTTVAHMSARVINGLRIPVPPIEVQREIVRVLDSFQEHIDTMRSEREARRKQFEHYRDRLLAFPEKAA